MRRTARRGQAAPALHRAPALAYASGAMPGSYGYTGQHSDASTTGLDYYGARYYDPTLGQFTSADTMLAGGLNRYAYVGGNPETHTDPSGHCEGDDEPDCPVAPEVRDPRNDYESSTNLGCTANCDDVPYGGEISYTEMAADTDDGITCCCPSPTCSCPPTQSGTLFHGARSRHGEATARRNRGNIGNAPCP